MPRAKALADAIVAATPSHKDDLELLAVAHDLALIIVEQQRLVDVTLHVYENFDVRDLGKRARSPNLGPIGTDAFAAAVQVAAAEFFRDYEQSFVIEARHRIDHFSKLLRSFERYERRLDARWRKAVLRYTAVKSRIRKAASGTPLA
jgi:hypothetical protein